MYAFQCCKSCPTQGVHFRTETRAHRSNKGIKSTWVAEQNTTTIAIIGSHLEMEWLHDQISEPLKSIVLPMLK